MEPFGELTKQILPPNIRPHGIKYDSGLTFYPGTIRIVSLERASNGQKIALAAHGNKIVGQKVTSESSTNDKWRMIVWQNDSSNVFLYNIKYGRYIARVNGHLTLIDDKSLPYINEVGEVVYPVTNIACVWNGLNGGRHIYLSDDQSSKTFQKDPAKGYCVKGSGSTLEIDPSQTCGLSWTPGSNEPQRDTGGVCKSGYTCKYFLEQGFCDPYKYFQPDSFPIAVENTPGIGTPITGKIYLNIDSSNNAFVSEIPPDIRSEMICTGTYVINSNKKTPSICWAAITQESPENTKNTVPSRTGWSISQLLSWDPKYDGILEYGRSFEPLQERFVNKEAQILPEKPYPPYFTYSTSSPDAVGTPTQFLSGTLLGPGRQPYMWNWQYVDIYTMFAGDQGAGADPELYNIDPKHMGIGIGNIKKDVPGSCASGRNCESGNKSVGSILDGTSFAGRGGRFTIPAKYQIDAAHKNGCKIYGCGPFMQEIYYGGQYKWQMQLFRDPKLLAKKLVDIAVAYGFDGWMSNFETGVTDAGYTWGGKGEKGTPGYSGQLYAGKNFFTDDDIQSDFWATHLSGSKMPAFRMHGGDLCEGCTTCGSGPMGCFDPNNPPDHHNSAYTCLYQQTAPSNYPDDDKKNLAGTKGVGKYTHMCSSTYVKGGGWADLVANCNKMSDQGCVWGKPMDYNDSDGNSLSKPQNPDGSGLQCHMGYKDSFPITCENPSSPNQIGSLKFSGGDKGEATQWAPENIVENFSGKTKYSNQITNAITLRTKFREFLQEFKKYKKKIDANVGFLIYDTEQLTGPLAGGITKGAAGQGCKPHGQGTCYGNYDLWVDDDGTPLADQMYDMNSGDFMDSTGNLGVVPHGITSTYALSNNNDVVENFKLDVSGQHYPRKPGWPKNTGPGALGTFSGSNPTNLNKLCTADSDCDDGVCRWAPFTNPSQKYCTPNNYEGAFINDGKRPKNLKGPLSRPYDYFQTIQLEGLGGPPQPDMLALGGNFSNLFDKWHEVISNASTSASWQQYIYCGIQAKLAGKGGVCDNDNEATEYPLSSILKFDSSGDALQPINTYLEKFYNDSIGIDYMDRMSSVAWTGGHLLGRRFRDTSASSSFNFKGFGHVVNERFTVTKYPFSTYFSIGTGNRYYSSGVVHDEFGPWSNWSLQDVTPTWQWRPELCDVVAAQNIRITYDITDAWQKGNCLMFRYTPDPKSWLYKVLGSGSDGGGGSCNVPVGDRQDCMGEAGGDKSTCLSDPTCCFDDSQSGSSPWCYKKRENYTPYYEMATATYMLYSTKLNTDHDVYISMVTKSNCEGWIEVGVSYIGNIMEPSWILSSRISDKNKWVSTVKTISATDKWGYIGCIWVKVHIPKDSSSYLRLGAIQISQNQSVESRFHPHEESFVNKMGVRNSKLTWSPKRNIEYYEIYENKKLIGLAYQGAHPRFNHKMAYNVFNLKKNSQVSIVSIPANIRFSTGIKGRVSPGTVALILFVIFLALLSYMYSPIQNLKILSSIVAVVMTLTLFMYVIQQSTIQPTIEHRIEHWQDGKAHALNVCFDDARVKCWRWLMYEWHKRKWPIKFSFYYNTLWLARDWDWLQEVIKLGHEIGGHGHDHVTASDGSKSEKLQADNITFCAYLLRKVYDNPNELLTYAYPHGSLPLLASKGQSIIDTEFQVPDDGDCAKAGGSFFHTDFNCSDINNQKPIAPYKTCADECHAAGAPEGCKTCGGQGSGGGAVDAPYVVKPFVNALQQNYINARRVDADSDPNEFIGVTHWPKNQRDIDSKNTHPEVGPFWKTQEGFDLDPIWTFPYQIDLNDSNDSDKVTKKYIEQYEKCMAIPNSMIIMAGHDFNPVDPETGKDVPCDGGQQGDVPMSIQKITCACCSNPTSGRCPILKPEWGGAIPLYDSNGKFPEINWKSRPGSDPFTEGGVPKGVCDLNWDESKAGDICTQACDACWGATPGKSIIDLFERIIKDKDLIWFATAKEIVAYNYNRLNSKLVLKKQRGNIFHFELTTSFSYGGHLSLSFEDAHEVSVDGNDHNIYKTKEGLTYIKIRAKEHSTQKIRVVKKK